MAVGFDAVGPSASGAISSGATTLSWSHTVGVSGTYLLVGATLDVGADAGFSLTAKYNGVLMTSLGIVHTNNSTVGFLQVWGMANPPTGSALTVLITAAGGTPSDLNGGSISFTGAGSLTAVQTAFGSGTTASLAFTPTIVGNMVAAFAGSGSSLTANGSFTGRYSTAGPSTAGAGFAAGSTIASTGSSVTPSWTIGGTDFWAVIAVEVKASIPPPPSPPAPVPQKAPGWFPGSAAVTQDPGGIPFYAEPVPTDATPAIIAPVTPEAAAVPAPLPPGWFPGADRVTTEPDGIPFYAQPLPITATPAVIFPVPEMVGEVQWLPWPPNYFPGSQSVSVDPGGIPFYQQPQPLTPPPAPPPVPVISTLAGAGSGGYFADQNGTPRLGLADNPWGLIPNAGRWSGTWRSTLDDYFKARGGQGFTAIYLDPYGNTVNGGLFADGRTFDGVYPFNSGATNNPSSGLNDTYFQRIDYAIASAATFGIAILMNIGYVEGASADMGGTGCLAGKTIQQYTDYGAFLAARYANTPNLMWVVGNDYFDSFQNEFTAMKAGLRGGGANQTFMVHNMPESTGRRTLDTNAVLTTGTALSDVNFCYTYNCGYFCIEQAYTEASPLPVILGDGYFYASSSSVYTANLDRAARQEVWWSFASGSRLYNLGSEGIWQWSATAAAQTTGEYFYNTQAAVIRTAIEALPGWHKLIPDTSSQLVTAGRGTRATSLANGGGGGQYEPAFTNNYVAASLVSDGTLALLYLPAATTITVNQTLLVAGYTATWVDPVSGATFAATPGSTYNSTAQGSNSQGDPDWVLVLQGQAPPPAIVPSSQGLPDWIPMPPGWFPGADKTTALPGGIPFYVSPVPDTGLLASVALPAPLTDVGAGSDALAITAGVPLAEAGAGTDVLGLISGVSLTEAGTGSDSLAIVAGVDFPDAGTGADSLTALPVVPLADAGVASDALSVAVGAAFAESGAGSDGAGILPGFSDGGAATDTLAIVAGVALAESGAGADSAGVMPGLTDAGAGSDGLTATVVTAVALTDAGAGADSIAVMPGLAETGTGTDSLAVAVSVAFTESGTGTDGNAAPPGLTDTGAGADTLGVAAGVPLTDSGAGTDSLTTSVVTIVSLTDAGTGGAALGIMPGLTDTGAGTDALTLTSVVGLAESGAGSDGLGVMPGLTDTGTGSDGLTMGISQPLAEAGSGTDSLTTSVVFAVSLTDTGVGSDSLAVVSANAVAFTEAGAGTDSFSKLNGFTEAGTGTDALAIVAVQALAEAGAGLDALGITASVGLAEAGTGSEAFTFARPAPLADSGAATPVLGIVPGLSESGHGSDSLLITIITGFPGTVTISNSYSDRVRATQSPDSVSISNRAHSVTIKDST